MTDKIKIKLNVDLDGNKAGKELYIETDENGTPLAQFWRMRIEDAKVDNCLEIMDESKPARGR